MQHGKITDLDCLKKAVQSTPGLKLKIYDHGEYWDNSALDFVPCLLTLQRTGDGCGGHQVGIVMDIDGTYHLEWDAGNDRSHNELVNERILRGVQKIMAVYEQCIAAKAKARDTTYEEAETERQNQILENQATQTKEQVKARA